MNVASDTAEQMTKMLLEGTEVTLKVTGKASKELIVLIYAMIKQNKRTIGQTRLTNLLKSGKELKVFTIKKEQLPLFMKEAKRYGILYTALISRKHKDLDGIVDILVQKDDASKINRIVERFKIITQDSAEIKTEISKEFNNVPLKEKNQSEKQSTKSQVQEGNKKASIKDKLESAKIEAKIVNQKRMADKIKNIDKVK